MVPFSNVHLDEIMYDNEHGTTTMVDHETPLRKHAYPKHDRSRGGGAARVSEDLGKAVSVNPLFDEESPKPEEGGRDESMSME